MKSVRTWGPVKLAPEGHRVAPFVPQLIPEGTRDRNLWGSPSGIWPNLRGKGITALVEVSGTALIQIMGRHHPTNHWIEVARFTATETRLVGAMTELCAVVSGNTGTVAVRLRP